MRAPSTVSACLLAVLLSPALSSAGTDYIQTLEIQGTRRPVDLETRAGETLDFARVERDVGHLWSTGWFDDIKAESAGSPEGVRVTFTVVERPRLYLRRIDFEPARERRTLTLAPGPAAARRRFM